MKKIFVIFCCIMLIFTFYPVNSASADTVTVAQLGAALYGVANDLGLNWIFSNAGRSDAQSMSESIVTRYVNNHGGSITGLIGSSIIKDVAGKLIVPAQIYNVIRSIIQDYVSTNEITTEPKQVIGGFVYNSPVFVLTSRGTDSGSSGLKMFNQLGENTGDVDIVVTQSGRNVTLRAKYNETWISNEYTFQLPSAETGYYILDDAVFSHAALARMANVNTVSIYLTYTQKFYNKSTGEYVGTYYTLSQGSIITVSGSGSVNAAITGSYDIGEDLPIGKSWQGDFGEASDTNLDQLVGGIFDQASSNDINVDSEIIDDSPVPTPRPTTEPATDILGGINDLIGQQDQVLEGIDTITGEVSQTAEAAQEAAEAAQEAAEAVQEGLDVVSAQDAATYKFDLSTLFPFCIPFDIVRMLQAFDGIAEAPHVQIPFVIQSMNFSYLIDLDFSSFSPVAAVLRQVELIAFGIALAYATSKVIRW